MTLMKKLGKTSAKTLALAVVLILSAGILMAEAEEYIIGPDDVLDISFWQYPSLNTRVKVGLDGKISLDIIGQIDAADKTTQQLQSDIVRQISRLNKDISQAVIRVVEFRHRYIYIIGQVAAPGKMSFEVIPDLWTIINDAGGATGQADLSRVTIVRGGEDAGRIEVVNVREAIENETLDQLPGIRREDTIEIPPMPANVPAPDLAQTTEKKNIIYVMGAVNNPGVIGSQENIDMLEVLALAGGPSESADLSRAHLVSKEGNFAKTITIDLEKYSATGRPMRYIVQKEDAIIIPRQKRGILSLRSAATIVGVIASIALVYDRLGN